MDPGQMDVQDEQGFSASPQIPAPLWMAPHSAQQNLSDLCPPNSVNLSNVQHYPISSTSQCSQDYLDLNHSKSEQTENSQHSKVPMLCGPSLMDFQRQCVPMPEASTPDKDSMFDFRGDMNDGYFSRTHFSQEDSIATSHHNSQQQPVNQPQPVNSYASAAGGPGGHLTLFPHRPDGGGEGYDNKESGKSELNTSLANIAWLEEIQGIEAANGQPHAQQKLAFSIKSSTTSSISSAPTSTSTYKDRRVVPSEKEIAQISAECGRKKRPPYSYMQLIQMAICSGEDKHLTLKEIYKWIEVRFPFYMYNPNKGWKNSIRHNLSLYDIFERKEVSVPGKSSTSYWTLTEDLNNPLLFLMNEECGSRSSTRDPSTPDCDSGHINKSHSKKAPRLLLPKPDPQHGGYALIPVQGCVPIMSSQPTIVPATWALSHSGQSHTGLPADHLKSQKCNLSTEECDGPKNKPMRIAPKMDLNNYSTVNDSGSQSSCSWMSNTFSTSSSNVNALAASPSVQECSSGLRAPLYNPHFVDMDIELSTTNDPEAAPAMHSKRSSTPRKSKRKQNLALSVRIDSETVGDELCVIRSQATSAIHPTEENLKQPAHNPNQPAQNTNQPAQYPSQPVQCPPNSSASASASASASIASSTADRTSITQTLRHSLDT